MVPTYTYLKAVQEEDSDPDTDADEDSDGEPSEDEETKEDTDNYTRVLPSCRGHFMLSTRQTGNPKSLDSTGQSGHYGLVLHQETTYKHQGTKRTLTLFYNARKAIVSKKGYLQATGQYGSIMTAQ